MSHLKIELKHKGMEKENENVNPRLIKINSIKNPFFRTKIQSWDKGKHKCFWVDKNRRFIWLAAVSLKLFNGPL